MIGANGRRVVLMFCGLAVMTAGGCADFEFPSWVPFQGPASDTMPGVVSPRERVEKLKKLSDTAASATPTQRQQVSDELAAAIRKEKDPLIRLEIIRTLGHYPGPAADAILKAALSDPESRIRGTACEAWGKRNDAQAVALLAEALRSDADADVRLAAAKALGETKNPAAVTALGDALGDTDPAMQYRVVLSLKQASGKDFGENVERWQQYVKQQRPQGSGPSLADRDRSLF
jgi:HEAT repeat protein